MLGLLHEPIELAGDLGPRARPGPPGREMCRRGHSWPCRRLSWRSAPGSPKAGRARRRQVADQCAELGRGGARRRARGPRACRRPRRLPSQSNPPPWRSASPPWSSACGSARAGDRPRARRRGDGGALPTRTRGWRGPRRRRGDRGGARRAGSRRGDRLTADLGAAAAGLSMCCE